jgi:hypothetical protein
MIQIITGWDEALAHWVEENLGVELGAIVAIGFADGPELLAAVAYYDFAWPNIRKLDLVVEPALG